MDLGEVLVVNTDREITLRRTAIPLGWRYSLRSANHPRATHAAAHVTEGVAHWNVCGVVHLVLCRFKLLALFRTENVCTLSATYRSGIGTELPVAAASKGLSLHRSG